MAHSKVPKFGAWESGENVAYTSYFETARKGKPGGPIINPNEMLMNQAMEAPAQPTNPPPKTSKPAAPKQPKFGDWNEGEESPYTAYFDNPRKDKPNVNPGEPQMNRDMANAPSSTTSKPAGPKQPKFGEWNEGEEAAYTAYFENTRKERANPHVPGEPQMNRDMSTPATNHPTTAKHAQKQPKFGEWNEGEEVPYTAYFENTSKDKRIGTPSEPQMNRDMATPQPSKAPLPSHADRGEAAMQRANEQRAMGQGAGRGEGRRTQQVQFVGGSSSVEPSPLHHKMGGRGGNSGGNGAPKRSPYHAAAAQSPSVPQFGKWNTGEAENYTLVFNQVQKNKREGGIDAGVANPSQSSYNHTANRPQQEKQPKCGFLSWLCP